MTIEISTSEINYALLSLLKEEGPLPHYEIVDKLANKFELTNADREEREEYCDQPVFYHRIANCEQLLKKSGCICNKEKNGTSFQKVTINSMKMIGWSQTLPYSQLFINTYQKYSLPN